MDTLSSGLLGLAIALLVSNVATIVLLVRSKRAAKRRIASVLVPSLGDAQPAVSSDQELNNESVFDDSRPRHNSWVAGMDEAIAGLRQEADIGRSVRRSRNAVGRAEEEKDYVKLSSFISDKSRISKRDAEDSVKGGGGEGKGEGDAVESFIEDEQPVFIRRHSMTSRPAAVKQKSFLVIQSLERPVVGTVTRDAQTDAVAVFSLDRKWESKKDFKRHLSLPKMREKAVEARIVVTDASVSPRKETEAVTDTPLTTEIATSPLWQAGQRPPMITTAFFPECVDEATQMTPLETATADAQGLTWEEQLEHLKQERRRHTRETAVDAVPAMTDAQCGLRVSVREAEVDALTLKEVVDEAAQTDALETAEVDVATEPVPATSADVQAVATCKEEEVGTDPVLVVETGVDPVARPLLDGSVQTVSAVLLDGHSQTESDAKDASVETISHVTADTSSLTDMVETTDECVGIELETLVDSGTQCHAVTVEHASTETVGPSSSHRITQAGAALIEKQSVEEVLRRFAFDEDGNGGGIFEVLSVLVKGPSSAIFQQLFNQSKDQGMLLPAGLIVDTAMAITSPLFDHRQYCSDSFINSVFELLLEHEGFTVESSKGAKMLEQMIPLFVMSVGEIGDSKSFRSVIERATLTLLQKGLAKKLMRVPSGVWADSFEQTAAMSLLDHLARMPSAIELYWQTVCDLLRPMFIRSCWSHPIRFFEQAVLRAPSEPQWAVESVRDSIEAFCERCLLASLAHDALNAGQAMDMSVVQSVIVSLFKTACHLPFTHALLLCMLKESPNAFWKACDLTSTEKGLVELSSMLLQQMDDRLPESAKLSIVQSAMALALLSQEDSEIGNFASEHKEFLSSFDDVLVPLERAPTLQQTEVWAVAILRAQWRILAFEKTKSNINEADSEGFSSEDILRLCTERRFSEAEQLLAAGVKENGGPRFPFLQRVVVSLKGCAQEGNFPEICQDVCASEDVADRPLWNMPLMVLDGTDFAQVLRALSSVADARSVDETIKTGQWPNLDAVLMNTAVVSSLSVTGKERLREERSSLIVLEMIEAVLGSTRTKPTLISALVLLCSCITSHGLSMPVFLAKRALQSMLLLRDYHKGLCFGALRNITETFLELDTTDETARSLQSYLRWVGIFGLSEGAALRAKGLAWQELDTFGLIECVLKNDGPASGMKELDFSALLQLALDFWMYLEREDGPLIDGRSLRKNIYFAVSVLDAVLSFSQTVPSQAVPTVYWDIVGPLLQQTIALLPKVQTSEIVERVHCTLQAAANIVAANGGRSEGVLQRLPCPALCAACVVALCWAAEGKGSVVHLSCGAQVATSSVSGLDEPFSATGEVFSQIFDDLYRWTSLTLRATPAKQRFFLVCHIVARGVLSWTEFVANDAMGYFPKQGRNAWETVALSLRELQSDNVALSCLCAVQAASVLGIEADESVLILEVLQRSIISIEGFHSDVIASMLSVENVVRTTKGRDKRLPTTLAATVASSMSKPKRQRIGQDSLMRGVWRTICGGSAWGQLATAFSDAIKSLSTPTTSEELRRGLPLFGLHLSTPSPQNVRLAIFGSLFRCLPVSSGLTAVLDREMVYSLSNSCQRFLECTLPLPLNTAPVIQKPSDYRVGIVLDVLNAMERKFSLHNPFPELKLLQPSALYFASLQVMVEDIQAWETLRVRAKDRSKVVEAGEKVRGWLSLFSGKSIHPAMRNCTETGDQCLIEVFRRSPFVFPLEAKLLWIRGQVRSTIVTSDANREEVKPLVFNVHRDTILKDALTLFRNAKKADLRSKPLKVQFDGEEAIDVRGVRKEFITIVSRLLFQSGKGPSLAAGSRKAFPLFEEAANRCIRPAAKVKREGMALFELAGLLMAKALLEGDVLETSLSSFVFKRLLGRKVTQSDLAAVDPVFYRNQFEWIRDNNIEGVIYETFTVEMGGHVVELCPGGRKKEVTENNKFEYLDLLLEKKLFGESEGHLQALLKAFFGVIRPELVQILKEEELEIALCGRASVDPTELLDHAQFSNAYERQSPQIMALERILKRQSEETKSAFLHFVTGCSRLPAGGIPSFAPPFKIQRIVDTTRLPSASTCFNLLKLPSYEREEEMEEKLRYVLHHGTEGFGLS